MSSSLDDVDEPRIPVLSKPMSVMSSGLNANRLDAAAASKHPVHSMQLSLRTANQCNSPYHDLVHVRHVYGSALAMRLATERAVANSQFQQLKAYRPGAGGGGGSSTLYGEIVSGTDVDLQFEDYLGVPQDRPDFALEGGGGAAAAAGGGGASAGVLPHSVLEGQLRMRP
jgi:hypothetical protein